MGGGDERGVKVGKGHPVHVVVSYETIDDGSPELQALKSKVIDRYK